MLLFPPEWVPTAPYLALPSLTAVLREAGHHVIQRDINIEMYDHFFTTEFMIWIRARQSMQLKALQMKEKRGELTDQEASQLAVLEQMMTIDVFDLAARAEEAKTVVRGEQFYDADKLERALNTFREAMQYISAAYYPASLVFYPMESNLGLPARRLEGTAGLSRRRAGERLPRYLQSARVAVGRARRRPDVIGISIGTQMQLIAGMTFCKMIKETFPHVHVVVGGNVITRLQEELPKQERFFTDVFDTAILYEGEHALLVADRGVERPARDGLGAQSHVSRRQRASIRTRRSIPRRRRSCRCRTSTGFRSITTSCRSGSFPISPRAAATGAAVRSAITARDTSISIAA